MADEKPKPTQAAAKPHYQSVNDVVQVALNRLRDEREQASQADSEPKKA
ncbi:MAG: hypothetical protein IT168_17890 [Bryobacterales bacterium]|nr:hypothetical protein [Bryobacterales bacterium]